MLSVRPMELGDATMEGSFTVELFDILVYLLPGLIVLTAANWVWRGVHESVPNVGPAAKVACILLLAFFIGVLAHIVAAGGATVGSKVTRYFILDRTLAHFAEFDQVSRVVDKRIALDRPVAILPQLAAASSGARRRLVVAQAPHTRSTSVCLRRRGLR